jgi:hypothetical protein
MRTLILSCCIACVVAASGCGGAPAPKADTASGAASASPADSAASKPADKPPVEKSDKTPRQVLSDPDVTFVLAFDASDPGKAAEGKCTDKSKGDSKKLNECMAAARDKLPVDAMRFKEDDEKNLWWMSLKRRGTSETVLHKVQFEFGEESEHGITIKTKGRDTGTTPWAKVPAEVTFEVPNSFSVSLKDPQAGVLVYEAKIIVSEKK